MTTDESGDATEVPAQACAVPFRRGKTAIEFCVVTSSRGRWLFPKGSVEPGWNASETALREAYEEAGLHGQILGRPLGYFETLKNGDRLPMVALLMQVERTDQDWPEHRTRRRRWLTPRQARQFLGDAHLSDILAAALARLAEESSEQTVLTDQSPEGGS